MKPKRSRRWILMLQAFVDECAGKTGDIFVMAGYVAPVEKWLEFNADWQKILDLSEHPHRPMVKAKMCNMRRPRGLRRAEMFYRVIESHVTAAFSCTVDVIGMKQAWSETNWPSWVLHPEKLSNPYYFAFQAIVEGLALCQEKFDLMEPVDFVFDEISCKVPCLEGWDDMKRYSPSASAKYMGASPIFRHEEEYLPIQAADLYANWVHSWVREGKEDEGVAKLAFAWEPKIDIPRFHRSFVKDDFIKEWNHRLLVHQLRSAGVANAHEIFARSPQFEIMDGEPFRLDTSSVSRE